MADPVILPSGGVKAAVTVDSPDSTTVEIIAWPEGVKGTRINLRSAFTVDGSTPVDPGPPGGGSGYTIGEEIKYQVVSPQKISEGGVPVRPYVMKIFVRAENVIDPTGDFVEATWEINFPADINHVNGITPTAIINGKKQQIPVTTGPTETIDGARTISTTTHVAELNVNDPFYFQVLARIEGPPGSVGQGLVHLVTSEEPAAPPTLPSYVAPFDGALDIGEELNVRGPEQGRTFRDDLATRKLYAKIRATDSNNTNLIHEAHLELDLVAGSTMTTFDVLVRRNNEIFNLFDLPIVSGAYELEAGDAEQVEVVLRPTGIPGTQTVIRGAFAGASDAAPTFLDVTSAVAFDENGQIFFLSAEFVLGIFGVDKKASLIDLIPAKDFRSLYGGLVHVLVDGTSTVNLSNTIQHAFDLRIKVPENVTDITFTYLNSANPDDILPIQAGTDVNGTITGSGTAIDPFILPVDAPEQLQVFATPEQTDDVSLAWLQTGYAYRAAPVQLIYPFEPDTWDRAFTRLQRFNVLPNPTTPGQQGLRPPRGDELILASGGTPVGGLGVDPGYSTVICLYARAQSVVNEDNVVEKTIYVRIADPVVLGP